MFTLRDFLRIGDLVRTGRKGVISARVGESVSRGGNRAKSVLARLDTMPGWPCRSQCRMRHHEDRATAGGVHGQRLHIDPNRGPVIARFGSARLAPGYLHDDVLMRLFDSVSNRLESQVG